MKSSHDYIFCIDASALITCHRFYKQSFLPELWNELENLFKTKKAVSHEVVYSEIIPDSGPADDLGKWLQNLKNSFRPITQA